jgi:hypothetical protein
VHDVAREIGENDSPGEGVFPDAGAKADMLSLLGDPEAQKLKGGGVTTRSRGWLKVLVRCHANRKSLGK